MDKNIEDRFWNKVDIKSNSECWEWKAALYGKGGYGVFWYNGKNIGAHRMSMILINGDIPNNKIVCHKCDNKKCVNPQHLFLGSQLDNITDMWKKGRGSTNRRSSGNYSQGEKHYCSKLSDAEVKEMRNLYSEEIMTSNMLATKYNVCKSTVKNILKNRTRKAKNYTIPNNYGWGIHNPIMRGK
jgi:hypothetical protein